MLCLVLLYGNFRKDETQSKPCKERAFGLLASVARDPFFIIIHDSNFFRCSTGIEDEALLFLASSLGFLEKGSKQGLIVGKSRCI